jgi:hypothetical protein
LTRNSLWRVIGALALALSVAAPAYADALSNLTVNIAPVYWVNSATDANAPPAPGTIPVGYKTNNPGTHDWRLDYGLRYAINRRTAFYYTHDVLDYQLDRVYMPATPKFMGSFISGDAGDRIDQIGFSYNVAPGLVGRAYFLDHERYLVSGFCLNQVSCGNGVPNPNSGDMHGFAVGGTYGFGPTTRIGPLFSASLDAQYIPRPAEAPVAKDLVTSMNGLPTWTGSKVIYPYGITANAPLLAKDPTLVGFLGYTRSAEYFRNNASQNLYNVVTFGLVKAFSRDLSVSLTNLNYKECSCSDTVPTRGETLRAAGVVMKVNYKLASQPMRKTGP